MQIEDISFANLQMECVTPFFLGSTPSGSLQGMGKTIRNISVNYIRGTAALSSIIQGSVRDKVKNISFTDIEISMTDFKTARVHDFDPVEIYGEFSQYKSPNSAFLVQRATNVSFRDVRIHWDEAENPVWKYGLLSVDSENTICKNCDFGKKDML